MSRKKVFSSSVIACAKLALCVFILWAFPVQHLFAQPVPVGDIKDNQYRTLQLLSDSTIATSLTNRPLWMPDYRALTSQFSPPANAWWSRSLEGPRTTFFDFFEAGIYEPVLTNTYNSSLPYSENNDAAWYGRGLNSELKGGFYLTSDYLTLTFRPHLIYTQNRDFPTPRFIPTDSEGNPRYTAIFSNIDMPFRFGPDSNSDFSLGHSSARIHYKGIEAGASTESLWWGPGVQYALMMSNNAAGIPHLFWGTRAPIPLPLNIGAIEFRWVWGWPRDSKYFSRNNNQRFLNALNFSYSPSFIPNLTVGLTRSFHQYVPESGLDADDFFDIIQAFQKTRQDESDSRGLNDTKNQLASVYFRWVFPESNAEIYGEYFREDHNYDLRDFMMEPDHDRAYTLGAQKIVESNWIDFVKLNAEINSLVPNRIDEVRPQTYYYRHAKIKQGHTSEGQVLGAAIGPGSSSQYIGAEGYFQEGMLGLFVQRVAENDFFHYEYYDRPDLGTGYKDIWRHRINLNIGLQGSYKTGPLLLGAKLIWNKNYNYGRYDYGKLDVDFDTVEKKDRLNMQLQFSARYLFNFQ
ncbi:capsule assembly Wzi family protein [Fodinibius sediminis]|uniref:Capsule assembly protein Wzi n=1 Tax=Fodinibius sediminis TaxID=1214077 RepID=A0A521D108_9BACT|nr:capsule assembly Wzi family protein [Fodinibius sediminis]SMO65369.1 Capsule assembly protein Wzi [Fodinibius sediminis]